MEQPSILKDCETLLIGFNNIILIDIGEDSKIVEFDSYNSPNESYNDKNGLAKLLAIFLHGFPDNMFSFRLVSQIIVTSGCRRICYLVQVMIEKVSYQEDQMVA